MIKMSYYAVSILTTLVFGLSSASAKTQFQAEENTSTTSSSAPCFALPIGKGPGLDTVAFQVNIAGCRNLAHHARTIEICVKHVSASYYLNVDCYRKNPLRGTDTDTIIVSRIVPGYTYDYRFRYNYVPFRGSPYMHVQQYGVVYGR